MGPLRAFSNYRARKKALRLIEASGLFDADFYRAQNPELDFSRIAPIEHFLRIGGAEGRDPSAKFDTVWYLSEYGNRIWDNSNPLLHYLQQGPSAGIRPLPLNDLQRFESFDRALKSGLVKEPGVARAVKRVRFKLGSAAQGDASRALPLPPLALSQRIGSSTLDNFESVGREVKATLDRCLGDVDFAGARSLDFGCGVGRVIRHFDQEAKMGEVWGCDIDSTSIMWCMEHLAPPFRFFQLSDAPVLPFESNSVDVVYAIAVFSQLFRDWTMWAMEIRRILKPGGRFLMTYNGPGVFHEVFGLGSFDSYMSDTGFLVWGPFNPWNQGGPHTAMSSEWIAKMWGTMFDIDYIAIDGLMDYQSISVMRKPTGSAAIAAPPPVHRFGTSQAFSESAIGKIDASFDARKPFLESFGVESSTDLVVTGWVVFRGDEPVDVIVRVDGMELRSDVTFASQKSYGAWDTPSFGFRIECDAASAALGRHTLELDVRSRGGAAHKLSMPLLLREPQPAST